ncbi:MAG: GTP cyclohydrolase I FolE [Clostridiales bacterium]|nr:GTP cyclohydrolase I FolE [Clostridiales bacterium]
MENGKHAMDKQLIMEAVRMLLIGIGEDIGREGLLKTPERVADMYAELFDGLFYDPKEHLQRQFVEDKHGEMVLVKGIPFYSVCEHHMLPFIGKAHVAYIPKNGVITGISKIARVVEGYSHRLQLQERMTTQIADALVDALKPQGVLVVLEAEHLCMSMRGVKKPGTLTVTSAVRGIFHTNATRNEAMSLIKPSF